ncbi:GNAT family N-acetyltransferase [Qipengyuania flava]|uniref:GNAT family N-acetyltransferase n=1 Tax=Qipengyuania flava TaxID=192812 RepID=UPI001C6368EF|nr:GNAT family N-acetyltransferase [Qipengyuania flava]QYJ07848.1 GNAT family N-acetyltransferase [Qipengyuania flava]
MSQTQRHAIPFTIGSRRILTATRTVATLPFSLEDILTERMPPVPSLTNTDGLRVLSAPTYAEDRLREAMPGFAVGAYEAYERSYIDMAGSYDGYLARFSGKTRSTLRRKQRKFAKENGGTLDMRAYHSPEELDTFLSLAHPLSQRTYQARLLDAGLPEGDDAIAHMRALAAQDRVRAFLLFLTGKPVAYLYLPVVGDTLVYAFLGYDPAQAQLSPGTVLQMAALESLFAEERFRFFDFTEGQGAHKALFGTDSVACASFLMLRPGLSNRTLLAGLAAFDGAVSRAKKLIGATGLEASVRKILRQ